MLLFFLLYLCMIKTKYGVIRPTKNGISGYVNFGTKYFCKNENTILMYYINQGYKIISNEYILQGGGISDYFWRYTDEFGDIVEEHVNEVNHPSMVMVTKLEKNNSCI
jgi:hypothetical protein